MDRLTEELLAYWVERLSGRAGGRDRLRRVAPGLRAGGTLFVAKGGTVHDPQKLQMDICVYLRNYGESDEVEVLVEPLGSGAYALLLSDPDGARAESVAVTGRSERGDPFAGHHTSVLPLRFRLRPGAWFAAASAVVYVKGKPPDAVATRDAAIAALWASMSIVPPSFTPVPARLLAHLLSKEDVEKEKDADPRQWHMAVFRVPSICAYDATVCATPGTGAQAATEAVQAAARLSTDEGGPPTSLDRTGGVPFDAVRWDDEPGTQLLLGWMKASGRAYAPTVPELAGLPARAEPLGPAGEAARRGRGERLELEANTPSWPPCFYVPLQRSPGRMYQDAPLPPFRAPTDVCAQPPPSGDGLFWAELPLFPDTPWRAHPQSAYRRAVSDAIRDVFSAGCARFDTKAARDSWLTTGLAAPSAAKEDVIKYNKLRALVVEDGEKGVRLQAAPTYDQFEALKKSALDARVETQFTLPICDNWKDFEKGLPRASVQRLEPTSHGARRAFAVRL